MQQKVRVIFFDFSKVIATSGYLQWIQTHVTDTKIQQMLIDEMLYKVDTGKVTIAELDEILPQYTDFAKDAILPMILSMVTVNPQMVGLVKKLKKYYTIALLTNYSHELLHEIFVANNLSLLFDEVIISSKLGLVKPQKELFLKALEIMHVTPEEALLIDDSEKNITGASAIGINTLLYSNVEKLITDLRSKGVRIN